MPCPRCGGGSEVTDTRQQVRPVSHTARRRRCMVCGYRFPTREVYDEQWRQLRRILGAVALLDAILRQCARLRAILIITEPTEAAPVSASPTPEGTPDD